MRWKEDDGFADYETYRAKSVLRISEVILLLSTVKNAKYCILHLFKGSKDVLEWRELTIGFL